MELNGIHTTQKQCYQGCDAYEIHGSHSRGSTSGGQMSSLFENNRLLFWICPGKVKAPGSIPEIVPDDVIPNDVDLTLEIARIFGSTIFTPK